MNSNLHNGISEQAKASRHRLGDARVLLNASRWRGAMYLAGYAVECLLKTKLMHIYRCRTLRALEIELLRRSILSEQRTVFTHQLRELLKLVPGHNRLMQNQNLLSLFNKANLWQPAWRYSSEPTTRKEATDFITAIERITRWIENNL